MQCRQPTLQLPAAQRGTPPDVIEGHEVIGRFPQHVVELGKRLGRFVLREKKRRPGDPPAHRVQFRDLAGLRQCLIAATAGYPRRQTLVTE